MRPGLIFKMSGASPENVSDFFIQNKFEWIYSMLKKWFIIYLIIDKKQMANIYIYIYATYTSMGF